MTHTTDHKSICPNRVAIIIAGIVFLTIFVANIAMLSYSWSKVQDQKDKQSKTHKTTWTWYPYVIVLMVGIICTSLYVLFYRNCDAVASIAFLMLPLLGMIASALQWPAYSLNPLAFGFQASKGTQD